MILSAVKQKEDGDGMVLRLYEMNGEDSTAQITLFSKKLSVSVPHNGLVTLDEEGNALDAMEWSK